MMSLTKYTPSEYEQKNSINSAPIAMSELIASSSNKVQSININSFFYWVFSTFSDSKSTVPPFSLDPEVDPFMLF